MEDVGKRSVRSGWLFQFILCGCCIANSVVLAATQGTIGQISVGSVSISVHIPRTVRLLVDRKTVSVASELNYCLRVVDTGAPTGPNYYQVTANDDLQARWMRLQNIYGMHNEQIPVCQTQKLVTPGIASTSHPNTTVLMLVPE